MKPNIMFYILLGCIGVVVIAGSAGYYLSHLRLQEKIDRVETLKADVTLAHERVDNLQRLHQSYTDIRSIEKKMLRMLPPEKKQAQAAAKIYAMIESVGLKSQGLNFETTQGQPNAKTQTTSSDVEGVRVMPVNFTVTGSYRQLQSFLRQVEQQERLMQVTSLNIQRSGEGKALSFDIQLEVFLEP